MQGNEEDLLTMTQAANICPGRPSTNCVWRWCRKGVKSRNGEIIRLQHFRFGGKIFTRRAWVTEFGAKVATADTEFFMASEPCLSPRRQRRFTASEEQRQEQIERARRILDEAGI